jgi:large subunit ribosomal protein L9
MKVLLIKDVNGLGKKGELKEVKDGYGQNFLIGKGFALKATNEVMKKFEAQKRKEAQIEANEIEVANEYKKKLEDITLKITHPVGANGVLIGSITKDEIAKKLEDDHNIEINKKNINMKAKIKSTGLYEIDVKLGHAIHGLIKIDVEGE